MINNLKPLMKNALLKFFVLTGTLWMFTITGHSQIQGGVLNEKKQGIADALLIARDTVGNIIDSVRSDKRGFYTFKLLKKGKYNIEASAIGFTLKVFKNIEVINEEPAEKNERDDISGATRLEIVLTPTKTPN
jgi:hypothetical protein